jgi:hypothetical protein
MSRIWLRWVRFWGRRESPTALGLVRVLICASTLYSLLSIAVGGVMDALWLDKAQGGLSTLSPSHWLWVAWGPPTPVSLHAVWVAALLSGVLGLLGVGGRWPLLATQQLYVALSSLNSNAHGGYDTLIKIALLVLFFSESHTTLSLSSWRATGSLLSAQRVPAWPRRLLLIQLVVMYTVTGFQKIGIPWTPFGGYRALEYVLYDPTWARWVPSWVPALSPLLRVATALSWHWEQTAFLLLPILYFRRTSDRGGRFRNWFNRWDLRAAWAVTGVVMHLGILLVLNVGPFSWVSLSYYVTLWSGNELDIAWRRLQLRWAAVKK